MITIRNAELADIRHFQEIHESSVRELAKDYYSSEQLNAWAPASSSEKLASAIEAGKAFVAEYNDTPAGYAIVDIPAGWVLAIYVASEYARQGVGSELCKYIERLALEQGVKSLQLNASLNALPFYKQIGYVEVEKVSFRIADGILLDCVNMRRNIG